MLDAILNALVQFLNWFFETPTPIITVLSFYIAYRAYMYQRKWNRKQKAQQLAEWYGRVAIPKSRYIRKVMETIGNSAYVKQFSVKYFTAGELQENLDNSGCNMEQFKKNFNKINKGILDNAFCFSGCNENINKSHSLLKEALDNSNDLEYEIFDRFVIDFLNELETVALQINCNLAEGSLIYPILHQTFINNMKIWYFFIAKENQLDHNRYYPNIIELYSTWDLKSKSDEDVYGESSSKKNRAKRI